MPSRANIEEFVDIDEMQTPTETNVTAIYKDEQTKMYRKYTNSTYKLPNRVCPIKKQPTEEHSNHNAYCDFNTSTKIMTLRTRQLNGKLSERSKARGKHRPNYLGEILT